MHFVNKFDRMNLMEHFPINRQHCVCLINFVMMRVFSWEIQLQNSLNTSTQTLRLEQDMTRFESSFPSTRLVASVALLFTHRCVGGTDRINAFLISSK